jgi:hypothetical protein
MGSEGVGECQQGVQTCSNGAWLPCAGETVPSSEQCDGVDNDCDGVIDEGFGNVTCGVGACANTVASCVNGVPVPCMPKASSPEACNGIDDDCDGVIDDGCLPANQVTYQTEPGYFDAVLDTERHQVFLSYGGSGYVRAVGLGGGSDTVMMTGYQARDLFFEPVLNHVLVSVQTGMSSSGYIAAISAISLANPMLIAISAPPGDIVADGTGKAYVANNSLGKFYSVDLQNGASTSALGLFNDRVAIHPSLNRAYGFSVTNSNIARYDIVAGKMTFSYNKVSTLSSELRIHPAGNTIYTQSGHLYLATNVQATDMTLLGTLGVQWLDLTFHPSGNYIYLLEDGNAILTYDPDTLALSATHPLAKPAQRIFAGPTYLVVLTNILGGNPKTQIDVIPYANL